MLDQNVTTLLAALVGGLLSALGGFLANYYIQSSTDRISKRKEIRNMLEKLYKTSMEVQNLCSKITINVENANIIKESNANISSSLGYINYLVDFYFPPLKKDFLVYQSALKEFINDWDKFTDEWHGGKTKDITKHLVANKVPEATRCFQQAIVNLFNKEGYNYFKP